MLRADECKRTRIGGSGTGMRRRGLAEVSAAYIFLHKDAWSFSLVWRV